MSDPPNPTLADVAFPARDEGFGALSRHLSEKTNAPSGDNFVSNEDSYPRTVGEIERDAPAGQVYLGVGPDQNFTFIAAAGPSIAFIADYRPRNRLLHLLHKALFALSADRTAYLTRLTSRTVRIGPGADLAGLIRVFERAEFNAEVHRRTVREVRAYLETLALVDDGQWSELATIQARLAGPGLNARFLALPMYPTLGQLIATRDRRGQLGHVLADENRYHAVRQRQLGDRVVPIVADFAGPAALDGLGAWLRRRGLKVGTFYTSDVEFFLLRAGRFANYVANLDRLPWSDRAVVIRSSTREINHPMRVAGDSSTTVVVPARAFLDEARAGAIKTADDLFRH